MSGRGMEPAIDRLALARKLAGQPGDERAVIGLQSLRESPLAPVLAEIGADSIPGGRFWRLVVAADRNELAERAPAVLALYREGGALWFAYPKLSGSIRSDLTRDKGWDAVSAADFLPVSQVALDTDWSALRFRPRAEIPRLTRKGA